MPHLRQDVLTGRWVICAPGRSARPNEFPLEPGARSPLRECPFCPGHEHLTTPEILAVGRPAGAPADGPGWSIRCFPNKFPALKPDAGAGPDPQGDLFPSAAGTGLHEVIVCSPDHRAGLQGLPVDHLAALLGVVRDRVAAMARQAPGHYILPFMNQGPEAGATLSHPHLQVMAVPLTPPAVAEMAARLARRRRQDGDCLACNLLAAERRAGNRIIRETAHWTALAPWASRFPWEVALWPRAHRSRITEADVMELEDLAAVLQAVLRAQRRRHGRHSFNLAIMGAPAVQEGLDTDDRTLENGFHWHLTLTPRLVKLAGFETGSGFFINPVTPEQAAAELRGEGAEA